MELFSTVSANQHNDSCSIGYWRFSNSLLAFCCLLQVLSEALVWSPSIVYSLDVTLKCDLALCTKLFPLPPSPPPRLAPSLSCPAFHHRPSLSPMFPPTTHTQNTNTTHPPSSRTHHFCYWTIYANPGSVFPVLSSSKPVSSVKLWPWVFPFFPDWEICHPKFFLSIFSSFSWQHFFISINFLYKPDTSLLSDPEKIPRTR